MKFRMSLALIAVGTTFDAIEARDKEVGVDHDDFLESENAHKYIMSRLPVSQRFTMSYPVLNEGSLSGDLPDFSPCTEFHMPFDEMYLEITEFAGLAEDPAYLGLVGFFVQRLKEDVGEIILVFPVLFSDDVTEPHMPAYARWFVGTHSMEYMLGPKAKAMPTEDVEHLLTTLVLMALRVVSALSEGYLVEYVTSTQRRKMHKRRKNKGPLLTYKLLRLSGKKFIAKEGQGGHHASPRVHLRRGHWRHFKTGKQTWVKPSVIGDKEKGMALHDYEVVA